MANALERLKEFTIVVADTGDFGTLAAFKPTDSTTNPSLLLEASQKEAYAKLIEDAVKYGSENGKDEDEKAEKAMTKLSVNFGVEILKLVPGRVSTELNANLSFDTQKTVEKGREVIALYKAAGVDKERVLLKIASTWEGLQAAKVLESEGLHCNLTLLFSTIQAAIAGEVGATLISPFAGRITDFHKDKDKRKDAYPVDEDPGVKSVREIYTYMKKFGYKTVVMGASFRTKEQVLGLAGCDLLTISPKLLDELLKDKDTKITSQLSAERSKADTKIDKYDTSEKSFRWIMNQDEMASNKLEDGIRKFHVDNEKLKAELSRRISSSSAAQKQ